MSRGYTTKFIRAVNDADQTKIGVQLGQLCIKNDIPVHDVAEFIKVTRMTVYHWFKGTTNVRTTHEELVKKLISKLSV
jgi:hypothetical protein